MTRPKVTDDKRQRTAVACNLCKKRKQKCDGRSPCKNCVKKKLDCSYRLKSYLESTERNLLPGQSHSSRTQDPTVGSQEAGYQHDFDRKTPHVPTPCLFDWSNCFGPRSESESDEVLVTHGYARMLQDPNNGRLLYLGDSATLSYLQAIRIMVHNVAGDSPFTEDPSRHKIMEATISTPESCAFPDKATAEALIRSYFVNTAALIDVLDRRWLQRSLDSWYSGSHAVELPDQCLIFLALSIGLVLATPNPVSSDFNLIHQLRLQETNRADMYFWSAKNLMGSLNGFEDGDFWSVQALCLMAVYMLAVSKRNTAHAYNGMAVQTAIALGLHRVDEAGLIFQPPQLALRRNVWKSLFVLDRFLAGSLGRPTIIAEDDCSNTSLGSASFSPTNQGQQDDSIASIGLDAMVKECQILGQLLKTIYSKKPVSHGMAHSFSQRHQAWVVNLHPALDSTKLGNSSIKPQQGTAILHVHLIGLHTMILLTRPFFLHLFKAKMDISCQSTVRSGSRLVSFSEACLTASSQTIALVEAAFDSNFLSPRNPFVLCVLGYCAFDILFQSLLTRNSYFLFTAALNILSNEFAGLCHNYSYEASIQSAINIVESFSSVNIQAKRFLFVLRTFHDVVESRPRSRNSSTSVRQEQTIPSTHDIKIESEINFASHSPLGHRESGSPVALATDRDNDSLVAISDVSRASMKSSVPSHKNKVKSFMSGHSISSSTSHNFLPQSRAGVRILSHAPSISQMGGNEIEFHNVWQTSRPDQAHPMQQHTASSWCHEAHDLP